ncbi:MAG: xanthine dehydrogenase family protein subunit M [Rhodobacteraceae bacterium]|nr:xanthine dehydrogenase family protein subunit M [Paracoccaceae bacterium]
MIPAAFDYHRPRDMAGVLDILETYGDDARVLAGGHSLIPMMKLRMAEVPHLIDLQDVNGLGGIEIGNGTIVIGAMTTQNEIIQSDALAAAAPIMRETSLQIADPQVRSMGTLGGNVANGDPGNDMPALMQCLNADFTLVSASGERTVAARDYYEGPYMTKRGDDEVLTAVSFAAPEGGHAYVKQKRKIGDYATAAAAVQIVREGDACSRASIAMTNLGDTPILSAGASAALAGTAVGQQDIHAATTAMLGDTEPVEDNRGPVDFKRHVAAVILRRAIELAWSRS